MGVYYRIVCDNAKERIDPGIGEFGIKAHAIGHPAHPIGQVAVFALLTIWKGMTIRLANDASDYGYSEYADVTHDVLFSYNARYGTDLSFVADED